MVNLTQDHSVVDSTELNFLCPNCNAQNLTDVFRFKTSEKMLGFITINVVHETVVRCPSCETSFRSSATIPDLMQLSDEQISSKFHLRIAMPDKFLVIAGWIIVLCAPVSMVLFLIALFRLPKAARTWRKAAKVGGVLTALATAIVFLAVAFS